jgi:hypothetical protein
MAQTVVIHKARALGQPVESVNISIAGQMPEFGSLNETDKFAFQDALNLESALRASLPGATYDRLAGLMLRHIASYLHIPYEMIEGEKINDRSS